MSHLIFLHIPKTAGITVRNAIQRKFPKTASLYFYQDRSEPLAHLIHGTLEQRRQVSFLSGHINFGLHTLLPDPAHYVIFLRRPLDRFISDYFHVRTSANFVFYDQSRHWTLADFIDFRFKQQGLTNRMTRMISGFYGLEEDLPDADLARYRPLPPEALEMAKANLRQAVIGIQEHFDESMLLLARAFQWPDIWYVTSNVGSRARHKFEVSPAEQQVIEDGDCMDVELYQYALAEFKARLAAAPITAGERSGLRYRNFLRQTFYRLPLSAQRAANALYRFVAPSRAI